jgi:hypothetical protein
MVNVGIIDASMYVMDKNVYRVRKLGKMLKELGARNGRR